MRLRNKFLMIFSQNILSIKITSKDIQDLLLDLIRKIIQSIFNFGLSKIPFSLFIQNTSICSQKLLLQFILKNQYLIFLQQRKENSSITSNSTIMEKVENTLRKMMKRMKMSNTKRSFGKSRTKKIDLKIEMEITLVKKKYGMIHIIISKLIQHLVMIFT